MAYAIQQKADGSVLYSDGSIRWPNGVPEQTMQEFEQAISPYGYEPLPQYESDQSQVENIYQSAGLQAPGPSIPETQAQQQASGSITADILRNQFGFNDPNVIAGILNDPTRRQQYEQELSGGPASQPGTATYSKSDLAGILTSGMSESYGQDNNLGFGDKLSGLFGVGNEPAPGYEMVDPWARNIGQFVGSMSPKTASLYAGAKNIWENQGVHTGSWGLPEFGVTEALAKEPGYVPPSSEDPTIEDIKQSRQPQKPVPIGTNKDGSIMMSDGTARPYEEIYGELRGEVDKAKQGDLGVPGLETGSQERQDEMFALLDESQEEGIQSSKSWAEIQNMLLDQQYQDLLADYDALIPQYQRYAQEGVADLETGLGRLQETGEEQKGDIKETYGERLASSVKDAQLLENKRRRMFSSLGTAESSAFIEEQGRADRSLQENIRKNQESMENRLGEIDKQLFQAEEDVNTKANRIKTDADEKIMAVERAKNTTRGEKIAQKAQVQRTLQKSLQALRNQWRQQKVGILQQKQTLENSLASIRYQGLIDQGLMKTQYDLESEALNLGEQAQMNLEDVRNEFEGLVQAPDSSYGLGLMNKYPEWSDIIGEIMTGTITLEQGLQAIQMRDAGELPSSYSDQLAATS